MDAGNTLVNRAEKKNQASVMVGKQNPPKICSESLDTGSIALTENVDGIFSRRDDALSLFSASVGVFSLGS